MKFIRTNLSPGVIALLIVLAILFAAIVIPILLIAGFCWVVCSFVTGSTPLELYLRHKARRRERIYEEPYAQDSAARDDVRETAASGDDTIECEVISARTFDENGREIR